MTLLIIILVISSVSADYWSDRAQFVNEDSYEAIGSSINLTSKEKEVNKILMDAKFREFDKGFTDPLQFPPAIHFFKARDQIENSEIFKIIQKLPKGASLHSHDTALVSFDYLYNLTFRDNLYGCVVNGRLQLYFFGDNVSSVCDWQLLSELRLKNTSFDYFLKSQMSLIQDDPIKSYPTIYSVWSTFLDIFTTTSGLICYRPIFQEYFYQVLKELHEDNVMYLEFRGLLPEVYELNGTIYGPEEVVGLYVETLEQFKTDYPDFHGARFIYAPGRNVDNETANLYVATIKRLVQLYPDFIAGFDLVGEEDKGKPIRDFIPQLLELASNNIKFFFHAAETNWNGISTDYNLVDSVLLNTTRIGHGYGILKHPKVLQLVKQNQIALEVSPISNQVLKLVDDLRNHPAVFLFASGYPVVITCDDPSFWGAKALSYDWYEAFMGFASREGDLRVLKQLALNSLNYSAMDTEELLDVLVKWNSKWDKFLDGVLEDFRSRHYYSFHNVEIIKQ